MYRPDEPRIIDGKPRKYEAEWRVPPMIDYPPTVAERMQDRSTPIWITEGVKKGDAGACAGLAIVDLAGVWNWLTDGVPLPDFRDLAIKGREIIICFDSDIAVKDAVCQAARELGEWLKIKGAKSRYCLLPHNDDGKAGLDDYLAGGHTVDDLWNLVQIDVPKSGKEEKQAAPEAQTIYVDVDGNKLLQEIREWLGRYISTITDADLDLLTLWAAHTHLVVETYTTPRLQLDSPVPESGKTTCIEHLQRLCLRSVRMESLSSPALLTRMLDVEMRTILIDEADRSLNPDKEGIADLLAILNSGYKRGGNRPVLVPGNGGQWEVKEMPTFAPVAIAGNNPNLPDDTRTRIIRVLLLPDIHGEVEESNWELIEDEANQLHDQLAAWADQVRDQVRTERPALPDGIIGRFREKWGPLKRIAVTAGGDWPDRVDAMALHDKKAYEMDKEDGLIQDKPAVVLLSHIHKLWPVDTQFLPTKQLIELLVDEYPTVWGPQGPFGKRLTDKRLGGMLARSYKIHSDQPERGGPRGYHRSAFLKPMNRMGLTPPPTSDASDASDESDAPASDTSDPSDASDTSEGQVNDSSLPFIEHCYGCGRPLTWSDEQDRGTCSRCWRPTRTTEERTSA